MACILSDEEGVINPIEIKEEREDEFQSGETTNIADLAGLLIELKFLEDTFLKTEIKLGTITEKWESYFEDDISCNFNLIKDWVQSIKSCLEEITQKYRVDFTAPSEYFHNFELPLKFELKTGGDSDKEDGRRERKTRKSRQELTFTCHETDSEGEQFPPGYISDSEDPIWTPPPQGNSPPATKKPALSKTKVPKKPKTKLPKTPVAQANSPLEKILTRRSKFDPPRPSTSQCPICHKVFARFGVKSHLQRCHGPDGLKLSCPHCPARFHAKSGLKAHIQTHSETKAFICQTCGWAFHQHSNLLSHMKTHSEERPLKCDRCEATFKFVQSLNLHIEAIHSNEKKQCSQCGKMFNTGMKLKRHERQVHQSVRNHACPKCDKAFKRISHLRYHVKTHDNPNTKNRGLNKPKE